MIARAREPRPAVPVEPQTARQRGGAKQGSWSFVLLCSMAPRALRRLVAGEVVGLHPAGRADRETGLGPRSNLARGLHVAAHEGRLRGCEIRARQVVLLAIGHGQLAVGV